MKTQDKAKINSLPTAFKRTAESLHDVLDSWEWRIKSPDPDFSSGCSSIDNVVGGLYPGDLFVVAGDYVPYFDAIARAMVFSAIAANRQVMIMAQKSNIRNFWHEAFARELGEPVTQVARASLTEEKWLKADKLIKQLIHDDNVVTAVISGYRLNYLSSKVEEAIAVYPETEVFLIEGAGDSDLSSIKNSSIGQGLKYIAQRHEVCIILSVGLTNPLKTINSSQVFACESEIPVFADVIILCKKTKPAESDGNRDTSTVDLHIEGRTISTTRQVPIEFEQIARLDLLSE